MKPIISYNYLTEGENKGKVSICANGKEVKIIPLGQNGFVSSWQENTLSAVESVAKELFPDGYELPYYVDGAGYVREDKVNQPNA